MLSTAKAKPNSATPMPVRGGSRFVIAVAVVVLPLLALWGGFALWFQIAGGPTLKVIGVAVWFAVSIAALVTMFTGNPVAALGGFAVAFAGLLLWWVQIHPSTQRD